NPLSEPAEPAEPAASATGTFAVDALGASLEPPSLPDLPRPVEVPRPREGRVTPPWQADDLPAEPPSLRLVEPAPLIDPSLRLVEPAPLIDPSLRLVEPAPLV